MSTSHDMVDAATEAVKSVIDDIPRGHFMDEDMGSSQPPIRNGRAPPKVNIMGSLLEGDDEVGKAGFSSEQQEEGSREQQARSRPRIRPKLVMAKPALILF
jgi:hypothetical protein